MVVGAPYNQSKGSNTGHARVFEYNGFQWIQLGADLDGEAVEDFYGTSVSISGDGKRVAIGGILNDGNGIDAGHVRVFEFSGGSWMQLGSDIDGEAVGDESGRSIALSNDGSVLVIGAYKNDGSFMDSGHMRVYELVPGSWRQIATDIDGEAGTDYSGISVSISADGSRVAMGGIWNDGAGTDAGYVRVFENMGGTWIQLGSDIDGEAAGDWAGISISLSANGNRIAIGALNNGGNGAESGHVRIYEYDSGAWKQIGIDIDGEAAGDNSGIAVALNQNGTTVVIGAYDNGGNGVKAGHARVYSGFPPVGIEKIEKNRFSVYPNPFLNIVTVSFAWERSAKLKIQLMDQRGRVIYSGNKRANQGENNIPVNLSHIDEGLYFLKMVSKSSTQTIPLIKAN